MAKSKSIAGLKVLEVPGDPGGPGIVLFHGYGADAADLLPLAQDLAAPLRPTWFFPEGPIDIALGFGYTGKAWFPIDFDALQAGDLSALARDLAQATLRAEQLIAELHIPLSKLFLGGFSQGAVLATEAALSAPQSPAGLMILSGSLVHEESWRKKAALHKGLTFFQSHGETDPLLPLAKAQALEALLKHAGWKGHLETFPDGHTIPPAIVHKLYAYLGKHLTA